MTKISNPHGIKIHRNYNVTEVAQALKVHKNTVRRWIKTGLPVIGGRGETLMLGSDIRSFLKVQRGSARRPCPPGQLFCFRCRSPRRPAAEMIDFVPLSATSGNLNALCPECLTLMHRIVRKADLPLFTADRMVSPSHAPLRLNKKACPSLYSDSNQDADDHEKSLP